MNIAPDLLRHIERTEAELERMERLFATCYAEVKRLRARDADREAFINELLERMSV